MLEIKLFEKNVQTIIHQLCKEYVSIVHIERYFITKFCSKMLAVPFVVKLNGYTPDRKREVW